MTEQQAAVLLQLLDELVRTMNRIEEKLDK